MIIPRKIILTSIFSMVCFAVTAANTVADTPKNELIGYWKFKRGIGGPCRTQIRKLDYAFLKDGRYKGNATMSTGVNYEYAGTFTATDSSCTVFIEGKTVGPFPYRIENDVLVVKQPEFNCEVELVREDW